MPIWDSGARVVSQAGNQPALLKSLRTVVSTLELLIIG